MYPMDSRPRWRPPAPISNIATLTRSPSWSESIGYACERHETTTWIRTTLAISPARSSSLPTHSRISVSDPRDVVAAVDVGGTRVKAALVARPMEVIAELTTPTPYDIDKAFGAAVAETVSRLVSAARVGPVRLAGCGIVVPGLVDEEAGVGRLSVNLRWRDLPIRDVVTARIGVPTAVGHDVRAGLLAEARAGAARGVRNAVFIAIGTGIAGGLMLDGSIVSADGWAGALGNVVVDEGGPLCPCGQRGCLETISSAA